MTGGVAFTFEVDGQTEIARGFSRFGDDVKDLSPAFREMVKDFHEGEKRQFESEGHYGAGGWTSLAPSTLERKARGGFPSNILVRTGKLRTSLISSGGHGVEIVFPLSMKIGTDLEYAIYHQRGTSRMPSRPIIQFPEEQKTRWHKIIHKFLVRKMKEVF